MRMTWPTPETIGTHHPGMVARMILPAMCAAEKDEMITPEMIAELEAALELMDAILDAEELCANDP